MREKEGGFVKTCINAHVNNGVRERENGRNITGLLRIQFCKYLYDKKKKNRWACISNTGEENWPIDQILLYNTFRWNALSVYLPPTLLVASPVQLYVSN